MTRAFFIRILFTSLISKENIDEYVSVYADVCTYEKKKERKKEKKNTH